MKTIHTLVVTLLIAIPILIGATGTVAAKDILNDACKSAPGSPTCKSNTSSPNPLTGPNGMLTKVTNIVAILAGIAAVIVIVVSGIKYMTSGGDTQKVASAKSTLIGAIIGLVVVALAQAIIVFVIKRIS